MHPAVAERNTLKQFGITLHESKRFNRLSTEERISELTQQLESYTQEVLNDHPVSTPYNYWFDHQGNLFTNPSLQQIYNVEQQFDIRERGGKPLEGFRDHLKPLLRANPNMLIFWYSPQGKASYDNNPNNPFSQIDYHDGQLYIQYFDGKKVNAVAVKVTNEEAVRQFMPDVFLLASCAKSEQERTSCFHTNPSLSTHTIDSFLETNWKDDEVYTDKSKKKYTVNDIKYQIRNALLCIKSDHFTLSEKVRESLGNEQVTRQTILEAYTRTIMDYMETQGMETMSLSGSCGGSTISLSFLNTLIETGFPAVQDMVSLHSSASRILTQGSLESSSTHYEDYNCPHCGTTLSGEKKDDEASWRKTCDNCNKDIRCA